MSDVHLAVQDLTKNFGAFHALDHVSVDIEKGEFFVLLGPSGCGKSTLLRMIAGLETISSGSLELNGERVNDVHPRARNMAMIFQNYALYPHMTVEKNIAYPLKVAKVSKAQQKTTVEQVAELLDLLPYLDRLPAELSGGQRQRVAMGRALVREPQLFLMDEPLSNLDAKLRQQMRIEIKELQARLGITTLYVTHDQVEAMTMADRIMVLENGRVQQIGTPHEIYHRPASLFVAAFVGSPPTNFIVDASLAKSIKTQSELTADECIVAIRPEHLSLADAKLSEQYIYTARCVTTEGLGSETLCHFQLELPAKCSAGTNPSALEQGPKSITAKWSGDHSALAGTTVQLAVELSKALLYSRETGRLVGP